MVNSELSTEQKIKEAAIKVFTAKGKAGARMQDIADEANINKAMLHYYFRNKQKLFELVFEEKLIELFSAFQLILTSELDFEGKIRNFVEKEIDMISKYPMLPMFILNEVGKSPEIMLNKFSNSGPKIFKEYFKELVEVEVKSKRIRPVDYRQLLMNLMSLCIYPILAKPLIQNVMNINNKEFNEIIQKRKRLVSELILNDLKLNT
jgi:AcrR family transcriptional regulator